MLDSQEIGRLRAGHSARCRNITRFMNNSADAEDSVQDAYVRLLECSDKGVAIRNVNALANRISRNIAVDRLRRAQFGQRIFASVEESDYVEWQWSNAASEERSAEDRLAASQTLDIVLDVIAQLPAKCRQAYLLTCQGEHNRQEIAVEIGVTVSMIEKYIRRARDHIRTHLDPQMALAA